MDEQRKPRSREKKVVNEGKGVEKRGEGLGTGPVNNAGTYEDRREQQGSMQHASFSQPQQRPAQGHPRRRQQPRQRKDGQHAGNGIEFFLFLFSKSIYFLSSTNASNSLISSMVLNLAMK